MRNVRIHWSPQAKRDLQKVQRYIARNAPRTAAAFVRRLKQSVEILRNFPELGGAVPELEDVGYREIIKGNYRILYRFRSRVVEIVAVQQGMKPFDPDFLIE
jgi:toxin ParE1/3/4